VGKVSKALPPPQNQKRCHRSPSPATWANKKRRRRQKRSVGFGCFEGAMASWTPQSFSTCTWTRRRFDQPGESPLAFGNVLA